MSWGFLVFAGAVQGQNPIHVTYLWHMHQPIYYPRLSVTDTDNSGVFNFSVRGVHDSRTGPYTDWPKNAVQQGADRNMPHAGVQVSFSGSLMENLNGIWGLGWRDHWRWGRNGLRTTLDNPRLDLVGFAYHHSLMPLTHRESMKMQIRLHREAYIDNWNTGGSYSKGFFPPESSFAIHMIPALVAEGIEWVLVDSGHIDRTLEDLPWSPASSIRPNRADQRNGTAANWNSQWTQLQNVWAPTPVAAPFSYQPRRMRYVEPTSDPNNPTVHSMLAVPAARYEGNENARGGYGAFKPENVWGSSLDRNNDSNRPMLMVAHSDGDNFGMLNADVYHGQHGLFLNMIQSNPGFAHTTVQDYLELYPVPANDPYIHVEPGSWIGIDGGTPYFEKWVENNPVDGEHPDHWNWSVLIAAMNRVLHAESLENTYSMNDVRWGIGPDTAKAWFHYLNAEASDYWYWDFDRANPWDANVTRAANLSITEANKVIARHPGVDTVGPSIFHPQRPIWNPGGKHWNEPGNQPSNFEVWTFVDDVSGVSSVRLYWRTVNDVSTYNNLNEFRHELYAHTPGLHSSWTIVPMTGEWYPPVKGPLVPDPLNRAMRYSGYVMDQSEVMVSYFVEAVDNVGNTNRSEIFHVWVGDATGGGQEPRVEFDPAVPVACEPVTIKYRKAGSPLGAGPVYIHVGRNGWQDVIQPNPMMTDDGDFWVYTYMTPPETAEINVVFNNGSGAWDNNSGNDWRLTLANCSTNEPPDPLPVVWTDPASPVGCGPVTVYYNPAGRNLVGANPVNIHIGRNGWQDVILPNPAMTLSTGIWSYVYTPAPGTTNLNFVFNNGGATWDNNGGLDWHVAIAGCDEGDPPPTGLAITNPAN
ncbi:MAG TPA: carbohydrate-binding protein, partial [Kiritimatiellia bacterium]|nr:carbohydrate-binding protein [Kiritimatiellia bacterium]